MDKKKKKDPFTALSGPSLLLSWGPYLLLSPPLGLLHTRGKDQNSHGWSPSSHRATVLYWLHFAERQTKAK